MGIRDFGQWKAYALQRFVGILHMTVRNSLSTNSPIPDWAAEKVKEILERAGVLNGIGQKTPGSL